MLIRLFIIGLLLVVPRVAAAGLRGPGEYSGVVVFDRWDTCYLYEGVYLMYIASRLKENLRKHEGRRITIDATRVIQPMNPGDGLIEDFRNLRISDTSEPSRLKFSITPKLVSFGPEFLLEIRNTSSAKVMLPKWNIAPTVFTKMRGNWWFSPSDGDSTACITRLAFPYADGGLSEIGYQERTTSGELMTVREWFGLSIDNGNVPWDYLTLEAGQSKSFQASFSLSAGNYDFLFGYAATLSNIMSFSVDRFGAVRILGNRRIGEHRDENSNH